MFNRMKSFAGRLAAGATAAVSSFGVAHADILTDTQTAVSGAAADALTVGGYVVAGVCSLLVIGLILKFAGKLK